MEDLTLILELTTLTAAEANFEANPTPSMDKWVDKFENDCTQMYPQNNRKPA